MVPPVGDSEREGFLVVGLGNPGPGYCFNRHNVGFMAVDRLARELDLTFEAYGGLGLVGRCEEVGASSLLLKPLLYMNRSGRAVGELADRHDIPIERILVVSDEFQLPLGTLRLRRRGSDGGHKGLRSVVRTMGSEGFPRLRIGIGPVPEGADPAEYVLNDFGEEDREILQEVLTQASEAMRLWLETGDIDLCMSRYNKNYHE